MNIVIEALTLESINIIILFHELEITFNPLHFTIAITRFPVVFVNGSALVRSDLHELAAGFEVCQMKGTHIGASELTLFKSYEIGLFRIRPLCF